MNPHVPRGTTLNLPEFSEAQASQASVTLLRAQYTYKKGAMELDTRHMIAEAMQVVFQFGVPMGASHGIGHQLGPLGVGHGETSCILLPAVCRYNEGVNLERQRRVVECELTAR